jgi:uncharacterized damage-inducible protein DinB
MLSDIKDEIIQMEAISAERSKIELQKNQTQLERLLIHIQEMELDYNHCMQTETDEEKKRRFESQRPFELQRFERTKRILERLIQMDMDVIERFKSNAIMYKYIDESV